MLYARHMVHQSMLKKMPDKVQDLFIPALPPRCSARPAPVFSHQ
jgi:hypothetical protein